MSEKWIGEEVNTSGTYVQTEYCSELSVRHGGFANAKKLYRFNSRFGKEYNITDFEVVHRIEELLDKESSGLIGYLYNLIIERFGVMEFIIDVDLKIAKERSDGFVKGKKQMQKEMRALLGL